MTRIVLNKKRLLQIVPLSYTTIYELERKGGFPSSFLITEKTRVWWEDEVQKWLHDRQLQPVTQSNNPDVRERRTRPVKR
jgi:prophage regulatory protein